MPYDHTQWAADQDILRALRQPDKLREELGLRNALASYGWYLINEPEGNGGEAWVHIDDVETYIVGYILPHALIFDPGEDYVHISRKDFESTADFVAAVRGEFDKLVRDWYPE